MRLVTAAQMRALERAADAAGLSYAQMMELAGAAVADAAWPWLAGGAAVVLCGPGNNGGDGLVAALRLRERGADARAVLWRRAPDDERAAAAEAAGVLLLVVPPEASGAAQDALLEWLREADVIVDALLGTGARLPLAPELAGLLGHAAAARGGPRRSRVVAVDLPTGVDADSGRADPAALPADVTVTFAFAKPGHVLPPGAALSGRLVVDPIGMAADGSDRAHPLAVATAAEVAQRLPARPADGHKGTFGTVLIVAGSLPYSGAAALAAAAAVRAGAGLVTVAAPRCVHAALAAHAPEATFLALGDGDTVTAGDARAVRRAAQTADALLVGPGLTAGAEAAAFLQALLAEPPARPMVLDADALNLLAADPALLARVPPGAILTPHPGEMARLAAALGLWGSGAGDQDAAAVGADRLRIALAAAARTGAVVVLKGAGTVVASPEGAARIVAAATPALATAGTGDVLAGVTAALLAGGAGAWDAAVAAAWVHATAGQIVEGHVGTRGARARDVVEALPAVWRMLDG